MKKLRLAFISPPHADWQTPANLTWMVLESHYKHHGKYADRVEFVRAPYSFNQYKTYQEIKDDMDLKEPADAYCFGSYIWNYEICDEVAELVRQQNPNAITVIGGPQIGEHEPDLMQKRLNLYDYICQVTKPGEAFFTSLLDGYFDNDCEWPKHEEVTWEWRSQKKEVVLFPDYSVYEEHKPYLKEMREYAREQVLEPFMAIESTRGCPFKCSYCEWGGGIGTKVYKRDMEMWKRDVEALLDCEYRDAYLTDANFGAFKDRDIEIFRWSFEKGFNLTDISSMKHRDLEKRKELVDAWFDVLGKGEEKHSEVYVPEQGSDALFFLGERMNKDGSTIKIYNMQNYSRGGLVDISDGGADDDKAERRQVAKGEALYISLVPTISIQSISEEAMKVANRPDLSLEDKIKLAEYINEKCNKEGYPKPPLELILGMPGSTLEDFYNEYELYWNFRSLGNWRHDYMFLPDSEISNPKYLEKYNIKLVEVINDSVEEGGAPSRHKLYKTLKNSFKTISSCYSFTHEEMAEMWFMNVVGNILLYNHYELFENVMTPGKFCKACFEIAKGIDGFDEIFAEVKDILDPNTPPKSIKKIGGYPRLDAIMSLFTGDNEIILKNELFMRAYAAA